MRQTKYQLCKKSFIQYRTKENKSIALGIFDEVWKSIPTSLQKKLNVAELWDYIRIHLLPNWTNNTTQFHKKQSDYTAETKPPRRTTMEFYA